MKNSVCFVVLAAVVLFATGCSNHAKKFVGNWTISDVERSTDHGHEHGKLNPIGPKLDEHFRQTAKFSLMIAEKRRKDQWLVLNVKGGTELMQDAFDGARFLFKEGTTNRIRACGIVPKHGSTSTSFAEDALEISSKFHHLVGEIIIPGHPPGGIGAKPVPHTVVIQQCMQAKKTLISITLSNGGDGAHGGKAHAAH